VHNYSSSDIKLNLRANGRDSIKIQNTLCVPELRNNLLSVLSIMDKDSLVIFQKNQAFIKGKDDSTILTATKRNQLY